MNEMHHVYVQLWLGMDATIRYRNAFRLKDSNGRARPKVPLCSLAVHVAVRSLL